MCVPISTYIFIHIYIGQMQTPPPDKSFSIHTRPCGLTFQHVRALLFNSGKPKVTNFGCAVRVQEDILWFKISMYDTLRVYVC